MTTPIYSDSALADPQFQFFGLEEHLKELVTNLITDTTDVTNSNFALANSSTPQTINTVQIINATDTDDGTTNDNNEKRIATRRWTKNAFINNVMDPHIQNTAYTLTQPFVFSGSDILRITTDPTLSNTVCRKSYVDTGDSNAKNLAKTELLAGTNTWTGTQNQFANNVVLLATPSAGAHATSKTYVDTQDALKAPLANPTFTGTVSGITKSMVGLGNVDNTTDANKPISTATQTALDLKAPLANPTFTGTVSGITKSMVGLGNVDNTTDANKPISTATQTALDLKANITYVDQKITDLVGGAPTLLDTLNELSTAINNDPNFVTTVTNSIASKASTSYVDTQLLTKQNTITSGSISDSMLASTFLKSADLSTINSNISALQSNVTSLGTSKQDIITAGSISDSMLASTFLKSSDLTAINSSVSSLQSDVTGLGSSKQDVITAGSITDSMLASTFLKSGDLSTIESNISTLQSDVGNKQDVITSGSISDSMLASTFVKPSTAPILTGTNITAIPQSAVTNLTTDLAGKQSTITTGSISDSMLASTFLKSADLSTINSSISSLQSDVTDLGSSKQDVINGSTDLVVNSLNTISSTTLSYLGNVTSDIQSQIDNISVGSFTIADGSISDAKLASTFVKPSTAPILTGTNFTAIPQSAITNLATDLAGKQDTIGTSTDLSFRNLTASGTVSLPSASISDSMLASTFLKASDITGKQNTIGTSTDLSFRNLTASGTVSLPSSSISDAMLASTFVKPSTAPILTGTNFTGIPENAITNLTSDLAGKQATIGTSTDLSFRNLTASGTVSLPSASISDAMLASSFLKSNTAITVTSLSCTSETDSGNGTFGSLSEKFTSIGNNGTTNSYTLDYTANTAVYILSTAPTGNMTIRLNNCGSDTTKSINFAIIYNTTGKYYATTVTAYTDTSTQITLASSTPLFGGGTPSISTSTIMVQTFSLVRNFASNYVLSSVVSYY